MAFTHDEVCIIVEGVKKELAKEVSYLLSLGNTDTSISEYMDTLVSEGYSASPELILSKKQTVAELSDQAKDVIKLIVEKPEKVSNIQDRPTKSSIRKFLIEEWKWVNTTVNQVFDEITLFVR